MSNRPTPIRSQFNYSKHKWQVASQTPSGSWEVISNMTHDTQLAADAMVDWYIESYPEKYSKAP